MKGIDIYAKATLLVLVLGFMVYITPAVHAAGTASGTTISNIATINYTVGTVAQTPIDSTAATFVVDNKVNLTVTEVAAATVIPGATNQLLVFSLTNTGNKTQGYALEVTDGTKDFDMTNFRIYVDNDTDGELDVPGDTLYTAGENISDVAADGSIQVLVIADTPSGATDDQTATYNLIASTLNAGTTTLTAQTAGADTPETEDVVFADGAGVDDISRDGKHSADAIFTVATSVLSITKTSTVIRDPYNAESNPKRIPGAYIQYVITISNDSGASASATLSTITDNLDTDTAIDQDFIVGATGNPESAAGSGFKVELVNTSRASQGTPQYFTTADDNDGVDHDGSATGGTVDADITSILAAEAGYTEGELKAGESVTLTFNVTIQ